MTRQSRTSAVLQHGTLVGKNLVTKHFLMDIGEWGRSERLLKGLLIIVSEVLSIK